MSESSAKAVLGIHLDDRSTRASLYNVESKELTCVAFKAPESQWPPNDTDSQPDQLNELSSVCYVFDGEQPLTDSFNAYNEQGREYTTVMDVLYIISQEIPASQLERHLPQLSRLAGAIRDDHTIRASCVKAIKQHFTDVVDGADETAKERNLQIDCVAVSAPATWGKKIKDFAKRTLQSVMPNHCDVVFYAHSEALARCLRMCVWDKLDKFLQEQKSTVLVNVVDFSDHVVSSSIFVMKHDMLNIHKVDETSGHYGGTTQWDYRSAKLIKADEAFKIDPEISVHEVFETLRLHGRPTNPYWFVDDLIFRLKDQTHIEMKGKAYQTEWLSVMVDPLIMVKRRVEHMASIARRNKTPCFMIVASSVDDDHQHPWFKGELTDYCKKAIGRKPEFVWVNEFPRDTHAIGAALSLASSSEARQLTSFEVQHFPNLMTSKYLDWRNIKYQIDLCEATRLAAPTVEGMPSQQGIHQNHEGTFLQSLDDTDLETGDVVDNLPDRAASEPAESSRDTFGIKGPHSRRLKRPGSPLGDSDN